MSEIHSLGPKRSGLGSIRAIDYTLLLCDDLPTMQRFYAEILGFELHEEVPGLWASFRVGTTLLALRRRGRPYDGPGHDGSASVQLAFRVPPADVAVAADQLVTAGVELLEPVQDHAFGHRTLFVADPEHNVIEIYAEIEPGGNKT